MEEVHLRQESEITMPEEPTRRNLDWVDPEGLARARMATRSADALKLISGEGDGGESGRQGAENSNFATQSRYVDQRFANQSAHNSANNPFNK